VKIYHPFIQALFFGKNRNFNTKKRISHQKETGEKKQSNMQRKPKKGQKSVKTQ
jgi:hypothetical protein